MFQDIILAFLEKVENRIDESMDRIDRMGDPLLLKNSKTEAVRASC